MAHTLTRPRPRGLAAAVAVAVIAALSLGAAPATAGPAARAATVLTAEHVAAGVDLAVRKGTSYTTTRETVLRAKPSASSTMVLTVPRKRTVKATGKSSGAWILVARGKESGWARTAHLKKTPATPRRIYRYTTPASLNVRAKATTSSKVLTTLPRATKVAVTGKRSGSWTQITHGSSTGWVATRYTSAKDLPKRALTDRALRKTAKNGRLTSDVLCTIEWQWVSTERISCGAYKDLKRLNKAFAKKFGHDLPIDEGYRSYAMQKELFTRYGYPLAAKPGTSNHGWGLAIDLPDHRLSARGKEYVFGSAKYEWLKKNAPTYGWHAPRWAHKGGANPEPWHFEHTA